ncbi:UTRA domain-containing protein [Streptomyces sp. LP05-1]|uniref:UTRA domain-containing protein n=1 Tax=Streptomyces pyxinae TaxID=2970734 RepID=A0ABT2CA65_9ACTN|nr:UTRA domain-containing protein [Streptomyces sp. LP05-1]MCS0634295.1 UTRA domain-containing protein [Streptomyces sp. LP05-1]
MGNTEWISTSTPYLTPPGSGRSDAWAADAAARGAKGRQRIVHAGEVPAPEPVAGLLGLPRDEPVVVRRRIMYLDDTPCELTDSYYPVAIARGTPLAGTARIPGGAVTLMAELGHRGIRAQEEVTARMPSEEERAALELGPGEPVLRLTRLTLAEGDRPVQVELMTMSPRLQRLRYETRIG